MKRIVRGNDFTLRIPVKKIVNGEQVAFPLPACTDIVVNIVNQYRRVALSYAIDTAEDNIINARVEGDAVSVGTYALEVRGKIFGNDWRSKEYEQFAIVDNNASGDTAFNGELIEGEDSVEMNTALVILPPTAELTQLITDANTAIETAKQTDATLKANESERTEAEQQRASAEAARVSAENKRSESEGVRHAAESERMSNEDARKTAEAQRANAESERIEAEKIRTANETARVAAEKQRATTFVELSANVDAAISKANSAASAASTATDKANAADGKRDEAERQRAEAEAARKREEGIRQESETERIRKETAREAAESARHAAEAERVTAEKERTSSVAAATSSCASAAKKANDAATTAMTAGEKATAMAAEAEKVNVTLENSVISVTNRKGETKTVDVVNTDEKVNVTITSSVSAINVSGVKINVFINNGKTPQTYTTNGEGKVSFVVARGNYYEIVFPEYGNVKPISPIGYTALLAERNISVVYENYREEDTEKVVVSVKKYSDDEGAPWAGISVVLTMNGKSTTYTTDDNGVVDTFVPLGKTYTVNVEDTDGYHVNLGRNKRTYTATMTERQLEYRMYPYKLGVQIIDVNGNDYYLEEWKDANKSSSEAVAVKIGTTELYKTKAMFMLRTSDLMNPTNVPNKQWCISNVLFSNIATNGNNKDDALYYKGQESSFLIKQEAIERSLIVPAFDYVDSETLNIGGQTLNGFILSAGQMILLVANAGVVKQIMATLYGDESADACYKLICSTYKWTSTQRSATFAYYCTSALFSGFLKSNGYAALPAFAC